MALSRFSKVYRVSPLEEMIGVRQYIIDLIEMIKPKRILVNHGNHELRLGVYLAKNLKKGTRHLDDAESIDVEIYTVKELCDMIYAGKIQDSKTVSAILAYSNMIK